MTTIAILDLCCAGEGQPPSEPDWFLQKVAGLPQIERNLMTLKAAGIDEVAIRCDPGAIERLSRHLAKRQGDHRLPLVHVPAAGAAPDDPLALRIDGRRVYHQNVFKAALSRDAAGTLVPDPAAGFAVLADSPESRRQATRAVFQSLKKPTDGWVSLHLNRPLSISLSRVLVHFPVHPNWVTLFTFGVGILSALFSSFGTYLGIALGGVCYQLASVLDGVDGEIARVKFQGSRLGQWMDTICDDLTNAVYIAGVAVGVYRATGASWPLWVGGSAVALDLITVGMLYWQLIVRFKSGTLLGFEWDIKKTEAAKKPLWARVAAVLEPLMKRDTYALAFMLFALANQIWVVLPFSGIGLLATFAILLVQLLRPREALSRARG